jgi:hypothetical protein
VNSKNNNGSSPLYLACDKGHVAIAELLLPKGADVDSKDNDGLTPLYSACLHGYVHIAELLLSKDADVNIQDNDGNTPLHIAVKKRNARIVNLIIDKSIVDESIIPSGTKIDFTIKNNDRNGAIDLVKSGDQPTIGQPLFEAGARPKETDIQCGFGGCFGYTSGYTRITNSNTTTQQPTVRLLPPSVPSLVGGRKTRRRRRRPRTHANRRRRRNTRRFSRF